MPAMAELLLKRATAASGEVYDVLSGSRIAGRILLSDASPASQWVWTVSYGYHEGRTPTHGYAESREARDAGIRDGLAQRMKRTRHKRTPSVRRRALEFIAAHPGCTEALLAAENIPADVLVELVQSGLVIARIERLDDEDGAVEVTCAWITATGERVLAARG